MIFVAGRSTTAASERTTKSAHTEGAETRHARSVRPFGSLPIVNVLRVMPCVSVGPVVGAANVPGFGPGLTTIHATVSPETGLPAGSRTCTASSRSVWPAPPTSGAPGNGAICEPPATIVKSAHTDGCDARHARRMRPPGSVLMVYVFDVTPSALVGPVDGCPKLPGLGP